MVARPIESGFQSRLPWPDWQGVSGLDYVWEHIAHHWDDWLAIRSGTPSLTEVAAFQHDDMTLFGRGAPLTLSVGAASSNLFALLGVSPVLGRTFAGDETPPPDGAAAQVALTPGTLVGRCLR